jgi:hypothetical protein
VSLARLSSPNACWAAPTDRSDAAEIDNREPTARRDDMSQQVKGGLRVTTSIKSGGKKLYVGNL